MIAFEEDDDGRIRIEIDGYKYSDSVPIPSAQLALSHYFGFHLGLFSDVPGCPICPSVKAALAEPPDEELLDVEFDREGGANANSSRHTV